MDRTDASVQGLVALLGLQPHPEGGYYRELYRSDQTVPYLGAARRAATAIYYLLDGQAYSAWHRIDADEVWAFHAGSPLALHVLTPSGDVATTLLGDPRRHAGARFQAVVPAGCWFAAELAARAGSRPAADDGAADYALLGCFVAPGFEFSGFKLATAADMADAVRRHGPWLGRLLA
ncbi:cupin domain-containing protein [Castellaniella hirudinis]|uniref:cupin domain-containing protein n=1 Tax=Castellaniella hirudinis TaxID=1144617 RepID=UPI0039C4AAF5